MKKGLVAVAVAVILGASFVLVAMIGSDTAVNIKNKGYVTVKGFAKAGITSDLGIFEVTVVAEDPDLKSCYVKLAEDLNKVKIYLGKDFNVTSKELEIKPATIRKVYKINERGYDTDEFVKYVLIQDVRVESSDVNKIAKVAADIVSILDQGVKLRIQDPKYVYTKLEDLKIEMIGKATENARQRAMTIAKEGKFRLGTIADVRVGIFQITPKNSTAVSNYGINDTDSIEKEIKSVVEIKYFVK